MPRSRSVVRNIQKWKETKLFKVRNAKRTDEIDIQAIKKVLVKYDHGDERLIWRDNKKPGKERIIVLGTKTNLKRLRGCELGAADITYEKALNLFTKLMTVHGRFQGKFIPLAFVLLHKDPNQAIYEEIYTMLPRMNNLQAFVVDYDLAQINALKNLYPTIWLIGCLFHLIQAVMKHMIKLGWKPTKSEKFKNPAFAAVNFQIDRFFYLGFCRVDDVESTFLSLIEDLKTGKIASEASITTFSAYMKATWIGETTATSYKAPRYDHSLWNSHASTTRFGVRANNAVEAWNLQLQSSVSTLGHPQSGRFLNALVREHSHIKILFADANKGVGEEERSEKEAIIPQIFQLYDNCDDKPVLYVDLIR
uniref:MULE transposase domain-containing protein n=1 Tax=Acrobeloides nanus TaxID=290746 RepID=A0A914ELH9_9BILA